ncbi:MAG: ABC transporter substrate-binding protein, partial [Nitrospiraceae bacterium]
PMKRRQDKFFVTSILCILLVSLASCAQQPPRTARVGWMSIATPTAPALNYEVFRQGMRDLGYVEGKNLVLEPRYSGGKNELLPELIADLERVGVDVIVAGPFGALRVAKQNTQIPIVMTPSADPVVAGIVESLARPGGNVTGITEMAPELTPKRLEMLKAIVPTLSRVAILWQPGTLSEEAFKQMLKDTQATARPLGIQLQVVGAKEVADFDRAFATMVKERAEALIVLVNPMFNVQRRHIIERAEKHRLPAIYEWKEFVRSGGLISYGADVQDIYRRAAGFVDKILKGTKPADLPIEGPIRFDVSVNLKTAKALGLTIPQSILSQAIEALE